MSQSCHPAAAPCPRRLGVVTLLDFVRLTRANFLVILGAVTLGVLVMFGYTLRQPVVYTASSQGYVVVGHRRRTPASCSPT